MTRAEAERVAARLVTVRDESYDSPDGHRVAIWAVGIGERLIGETTDAPSAIVVAQSWRDAIVRALVEEER